MVHSCTEEIKFNVSFFLMSRVFGKYCLSSFLAQVLFLVSVQLQFRYETIYEISRCSTSVHFDAALLIQISTKTFRVEKILNPRVGRVNVFPTPPYHLMFCYLTFYLWIFVIRCRAAAAHIFHYSLLSWAPRTKLFMLVCPSVRPFISYHAVSLEYMFFLQVVSDRTSQQFASYSQFTVT